MILVSIAQEKREFEILEEAVAHAVLRRPLVDGQKSNLEQRRLFIPCTASDSRLAFGDVEAEFSNWVAQDDVTVLVSQLHPLDLNPLLDRGIESLLAMLILAFPEVRWLFGTIRGYRANDGVREKQINALLDEFRSAHGLRYLFAPEQSSLFDGMGLRDWVRQRAIEDRNTRYDALYLSRRRKLAIAMDEENDYVNLHAYMAYRFGFRALAISKRQAADGVLGPNPRSSWGTPEVILEDIFLNFPDGGRGLSNLANRQAELPGVEEAKYRIVVTSGQRVSGDDERNFQNRSYIAAQRDHGRNIKVLFKPHAGGVFSIMEKSGLNRTLRLKESEIAKSYEFGCEGYVWPPDWRQIQRRMEDEKGNTEGSGHSSPGVCLLIACSLLNRAKSMLDGLSSVEEAVRGAVLANDALELLGGKTPTTAAEALSLKHQFELHAECQFSGVEYHLSLHSRLKEIERDSTSIAHWFLPEKAKATELNIQMHIVNELVRILRDYNQFDEEQICINRVRRLHNTLWMQKRWYRWSLWPVLRYLEWLLSSFALFVVVLGCWVIGLSLLYVFTNHYHAWWPGLSDAISSFFSVGAPIQNPGDSSGSKTGWPQVAVACVAIVSGFMHLGVFISHLYSIESRK